MNGINISATGQTLVLADNGILDTQDHNYLEAWTLSSLYVYGSLFLAQPIDFSFDCFINRLDHFASIGWEIKKTEIFSTNDHNLMGDFTLHEITQTMADRALHRADKQRVETALLGMRFSPQPEIALLEKTWLRHSQQPRGRLKLGLAHLDTSGGRPSLELSLCSVRQEDEFEVMSCRNNQLGQFSSNIYTAQIELDHVFFKSTMESQLRRRLEEFVPAFTSHASLTFSDGTRSRSAPGAAGQQTTAAQSF